ncbi:hypothetical protein JCM3770_003494 [Rhodotorula araucariae]
MAPFPGFGAPAAAHIRIPTFLSPTAKRSPARAPANRDEARAARLRTAAGAEQWTSLSALAQAAPASLAHLLGRAAAPAPDPVTAPARAPVSEPEKERRVVSWDTEGKGTRASSRGKAVQRNATADPGPSTAPSRSSGGAASEPAASALAKPARRLPRAAVAASARASAGVPISAPGPAPPIPALAPAPAHAPASQKDEDNDTAKAQKRRLSGTRDAPSLAGKGFRRESDSLGLARVAGAAAKEVGGTAQRQACKAVPRVESARRKGAGLGKGKGAERAAVPAHGIQEVDAEAPRRRSTRGDAGAQAAVDEAAAPDPVPAPPAAPRPPWRRSSVSSDAAAAAAAAAQAEKRPVAPADEEPAPAPQARKRRRTAIAKPTPAAHPDLGEYGHEGSPPGPANKAPKRTAVPRNQASAANDGAGDRAADAGVGEKKQVRVATLRARCNTGALNALDVVLGGSMRVLSKALEGAADERETKALKIAHREVQRALLSRSTLLSSHAQTTKALRAAQKRARALRGALLAAQLARADVARALRAREGACERDGREARAV